MRPSGTVVVLAIGEVVGVDRVVDVVAPLWHATSAMASNVNFRLCFTVLP
jgi:hypothetical protein